MDSQSHPEGHQEPPLATRVPAQPVMATPRTRTPPLVRWLLVFLVLGLLGSALLNVLLGSVVGLSSLASLDTDRKLREEFFSHERNGSKKVAVITVEGTILTGEGFVKRQIDQAKDDLNVKAVVLRVNSPGGTVTGSDYIYHHLRELRNEKQIPIVVSMGGLAASGGYYVSMAAGDTPDAIFAEPTTWTGSIGVIIPHYDLSELMGNWGIQQDSIISDRFKGMGSFAKPMTEEERQILQGLVDDSFAQFKQIIQQGRPEFQKDPAALDRLATGQVFSANQAAENGLVDRIGFIEDAIDRAIKLAKLDETDVKVVRYRREPSLASVLMGVRAKSQPIDLATILEMTAPRAYYLSTWLPPLARSGRP